MARRSGVLLLATMVAVLVADQVTKAFVRATFAVGTSKPIVDGFFYLTHVRNSGAAFGLFPGRLPVFIGVAAIVLGGISWVWWRLRPRSKWVIFSLGLVAGGATGNLIDRVIAGRVTDFFDLRWWPVFNIADMALDIGVVILLVWILFASDDALDPSTSVSEESVETSSETAEQASPGAAGGDS